MTQTNLNRPAWAGPSKSPPTTGSGSRDTPARSNDTNKKAKTYRLYEWLEAAPPTSSWQDVAEASQRYDSPVEVPGWGVDGDDTEGGDR